MSIDQKWFREALISADKTGRGLAQVLGRNPAVVTNMLSGTRPVRIDEIEKIAQYLGRPIDETAVACGLKLSPATPRTVSIGGIVDGHSHIQKPSAEDRKTIYRAPPGSPAGTEAFVFRTSQSRLEVLDNMVLFAERSTRIEPEAMGRLSLVTQWTGAVVLASLQTGDDAESFVLQSLDGARMTTSVRSAAPVLWMRP